MNGDSLATSPLEDQQQKKQLLNSYLQLRLWKHNDEIDQIK